MVLFLVIAQTGSAQPRAIGPDDLSRLRQQTEFSGDWSETDAFDLDRYITVKATIAKLDIPDPPGNAVLWFTVKNPQKLGDREELLPEHRYQATLQTVDVVRFLDIDPRDLPQGTEAVIRGWPATRKNISGSTLLVDDINISSTGRTFYLHINNPNLESKRIDRASLD